MDNLPSYEIWVWIKGYEGRFEVSNRGRIRSWVKNSGKRGVIKCVGSPLVLTALPSKHGYLHTHIGNEMRDLRPARVHREVGLAFVPNPHNKAEVNHINGVKSCNEWWNFEWVTRHESIDHAFRTGLIKPALGEAQSNTKLTNEQVMEIYAAKDKTKTISNKYRVSTHTVLDIKKGRTWWHITGHKRHIKPSEKGRFKFQ